MRNRFIATAVSTLYRHAARAGLFVAALEPEVADLNTLPEYQRPWYAPDGQGKFKIDLKKVDAEDVTGLRNTVAATRAEVAAEKAARQAAVERALEPFKGIDPATARQVLSQFESSEEAALIAQGPEGIQKVIEKRMEKQREDLMRQTEEADERADGALEVASTFMEKVLDNAVRSAVAGKVHDSALRNGDVLRAAREIFSLDDDGVAVQYEDDGETVVLGKNGRDPYTVEEWIEDQRAVSAHWFPAAGSGGGAPGSGGAKGGQDYTGLSSAAKLTAARANKR